MTFANVTQGDCLEVLKRLPDASVDSIVTDPPYGLSKQPDMTEVLRHWLNGDDYEHKGSGFMGKSWDSFVPGPTVWSECLRVLKPGGHLVAFFGTRTYDMGTLAVRLAGFEIRDQLAWVFGSGFPKSHNGEWGGTALKPAYEPIVLARKPLSGTVAGNYATHGVGGLNIDGCRVRDGTERSNVKPPEHVPNNKNAVYGSGMGGGAWANTQGRWPANLAHDGSGGVADLLGESTRFFYCAKASKSDRNEGCTHLAEKQHSHDGRQTPIDNAYQRNSGTNNNNHPTVKPTDLMRWLCRLVTPADGIVLDPFTGSGSTGKAATVEGFSFIGIEQDRGYCEIARARITHAAIDPSGTNI